MLFSGKYFLKQIHKVIIFILSINSKLIALLTTHSISDRFIYAGLTPIENSNVSLRSTLKNSLIITVIFQL